MTAHRERRGIRGAGLNSTDRIQLVRWMHSPDGWAHELVSIDRLVADRADCLVAVVDGIEATFTRPKWEVVIA